MNTQLAPWWVVVVVPAGILLPPLIVLGIASAWGWQAAGWAAVAVGLANASSRTARKYFDHERGGR